MAQVYEAISTSKLNAEGTRAAAMNFLEQPGAKHLTGG